MKRGRADIGSPDRARKNSLLTQLSRPAEEYPYFPAAAAEPCIDEVEVKSPVLNNDSVDIDIDFEVLGLDGSIVRFTFPSVEIPRDLSPEDHMLKRAEMYQEYISQIPIPTKRGSLIPCSSWVGLGNSIKQLYGQPLHYLTNVMLKQWDQQRLGSVDENRHLDTIIHPSKAEISVWLLEEMHRLTVSPHHIAKLWLSDPLYHVFVDSIFPELPKKDNFYVAKDERLCDLLGGLSSDGARDSKKRIVKKEFVLDATGWTSLFTSVSKQEKLKGKGVAKEQVVEKARKEKNVAKYVDDNPKDASVIDKPLASGKDCFDGNSKKRKSFLFKEISKKLKKKSKHGSRLERGRASGTNLATTGGDNDVMMDAVPESSSGAEHVIPINSPLFVSSRGVDVAGEGIVGPSVHPPSTRSAYDLEPLIEVNWCASVDNTSPQGSLERLRVFDKREVASVGIAHCINAAMRMRVMLLDLEQQKMTFDELEKKYDSLMKKEMFLSKQVRVKNEVISHQNNESEMLRKDLRTARERERIAVEECDGERKGKHVAMEERDSARKDAEACRDENLKLSKFVSQQQKEFQNIQMDTWHNCLQQMRLKHVGLSVRDLDPDCVVVDGRLLLKSEGIAPNECDRNYPTDTSNSDDNEDDSSDSSFS